MSVFVIGIFVLDPEVPQIGKFIGHIVGMSILKRLNSDTFLGSSEIQILIIPLQLIPNIV